MKSRYPTMIGNYTTFFMESARGERKMLGGILAKTHREEKKWGRAIRRPPYGVERLGRTPWARRAER